MLEFFTGNWPSLGDIFRACVIGFFVAIILSVHKRIVDRAAHRYVSDETIDRLLTRFERNNIIKHHNKDVHEMPLKHCTEGHCERLSATKTDPLTVGLAISAVSDEYH